MFKIPFLATCALLLATPASFAQSKPNIVFLLADDQSTDSIRCYGNPDVQTPNLDRLAREGMAFDNHYASTSICMASRASVMTGRFEFKTGCNFEHGSLMREHWSKSYPVLLRAAGYRTAIAGKIGFTVTDQPNGKGVLPESDFDAWGAGPGQTTYKTAKNASVAKYAKNYPHSTLAYGAFGRDFIAASARAKKPFCLSISFKAPHRPTTPDPQFDHVYAGKKFRKPANYGRENGGHLSAQSRAGRQYPRFTSWGYEQRFDEVMAVYHQQIYAIDVAVGMIREALVDHGVADNTVVIYTSDNGFLCGSHGYGSKVLPYEESARVPLIVYDPRHAKSESEEPRRTRSLTGLVDIAPTILSLARVDRPEGMDGRSLLPIYEDEKSVIHEVLPLINVWGPKATHYLGVVTGDAKFVYWPHAATGFVASEELFITRDDPFEMINAIDSAPELAVEIRVKYDRMVSKWRSEAVPYHRYEHFGTLFDRSVPWSEKEGLTPAKSQRAGKGQRKGKRRKRAKKK
jgi:arylsulfatase A-like enzyme